MIDSLTQQKGTCSFCQEKKELLLRYVPESQAKFYFICPDCDNHFKKVFNDRKPNLC